MVVFAIKILSQISEGRDKNCQVQCYPVHQRGFSTRSSKRRAMNVPAPQSAESARKAAFSKIPSIGSCDRAE